ncbi:MAG: hypothetical protein WD850_02040 [Candidatus Spechtbacterales bacterium]
MSESRSVGQSGGAPEPEQLEELLAAIRAGEPHITAKTFEWYLRGGLLTPLEAPTFMTVCFKPGLAREDLEWVVKEIRLTVSNNAYHVLDENLPAARIDLNETNLDLVAFSAQDLGLPSWASYQLARTVGLAWGLQDCLPEMFPWLRLQYDKQPRGEVLLAAMEPVLNYSGKKSCYSVHHLDIVGKWLDLSSYEGFQLDRWPKGTAPPKIVFVRTIRPRA